FWGYNASIYLAATRIDALRIARIPWDAVRGFLAPTPAASLLAVVGAAAIVRAPRPRPWAGLSLVLIASGMLAAIVPGFRYFSHYAALSFPFVTALGAVGLEKVVDRARGRAMLAVALVALTLGIENAGRGWPDTLARLARWTASGDRERPFDPIAW